MLEAARLLQHFIIQIIIEYGSTIETKPSGTHPKLLWETKCGCAFFISVGVCCVCARAWEVLTGLVPKAIVREGGEKDGAGDRREKKWRWLGRSTRAEIRWNSSRICRRHLQSVEQLSDEWKTFGGKMESVENWRSLRRIDDFRSIPSRKNITSHEDLDFCR